VNVSQQGYRTIHAASKFTPANKTPVVDLNLANALKSAFSWKNI